MKRSETGPIDRWSHGGGDLEAAGRALAAAGRLGAYLEIGLEPLGTFVADGLVDDVRAAWQALVARAPTGSVARRESWFMIAAVVAGDPVALVELAKQILEIMKARQRTPPYRVSLLLIEIKRDDPDAAFGVDISAELQDLDGDCLGWITPRRRNPGRPDIDAAIDWVVGG